MKKKAILILCAILSGSLSGCFLSRSIIYLNSTHKEVGQIEIRSASVEENKLTVDYTVQDREQIKKCLNFYINKAKILPETRYYTSQGDLIVSRPAPIGDALPFLNDKEFTIVNEGFVSSSHCSNSSRNNKPENSVTFFMNQQPKSIAELERYVYYKEENPMLHYFYYVYKEEAQNEVHVVALQSPDWIDPPWYGPFLFILLPAAFVVDVVTLPLDIIFADYWMPR